MMSDLNKPKMTNIKMDSFDNINSYIKLSDDERTTMQTSSVSYGKGHHSNTFSNMLPNEYFDSECTYYSVDLNRKQRSVTLMDFEKCKAMINANESNQDLMLDCESVMNESAVTPDGEPIPLHHVKHISNNGNTFNYSQISKDTYRDGISMSVPNKSFINPNVQSDMPSVPINISAYSVDGPCMKLKNANSSGSSFYSYFKQNSVLNSSQTCLQPQLTATDINEIRNNSKFVKTQNISFSQPVIESDLQNVDERLKMSNIAKDNPTKLSDINRITYDKLTNFATPCRNEITMVQQFDNDLYSNVSDVGRDNIPATDAIESVNISFPPSREEPLPSSDFIYPSNCYIPASFPVNIADNIKPMPCIGLNHMNQGIPFQLIPVQTQFMFNSNLNSNVRNISNHPHFHLTHVPPNIVQYPSDNNSKATRMASIVNSEQKLKQIQKLTEKQQPLPPKSDHIEGSTFLYCQQSVEPQPKFHQFSTNNDLLHATNTYPIVSNHSSDYTILLSSPEHHHNCPNISVPQNVRVSDNVQQTLTNQSTDNESSRASNTLPSQASSSVTISQSNIVGKFTVKPVNEHEIRSHSNRIADDGEHFPTQSFVYMENMTDRDQENRHPQSRFKKTRIKEKVEHWNFNGFSTLDCRFRIIPSKILDLSKAKPDYMFKTIPKDIPCLNCDNKHQYYSQDHDYHNKDFKFWHNGDRISLCRNTKDLTENRCQFHTKFIKLVNQNENLSLSKYSSQSFSIPNNNMGTSQIYRAVLISSPEQENFTMNIDSQFSQNVALSAPPVSPSIINTVSMSNMQPNMQSPLSAAMVMLKCATPLLYSNPTRNTTVFNESIAVEKINNRSSPKMNPSSDSGQVIVTNTSPMRDYWSGSPINKDQASFTFSSPTYVAGTVVPNNSQLDETFMTPQQSLHSVGQIPQFYYSVRQQNVPSVSNSTTTNKCPDCFLNVAGDDEGILRDISRNLSQEIDRNMNSFKTMMTHLFFNEYKSHMVEIKHLKETNEQLQAEVEKLKSRAQQLEDILKEKGASLTQSESANSKIKNDDNGCFCKNSNNLQNDFCDQQEITPDIFMTSSLS